MTLAKQLWIFPTDNNSKMWRIDCHIHRGIAWSDISVMATPWPPFCTPSMQLTRWSASGVPEGRGCYPVVIAAACILFLNGNVLDKTVPHDRQFRCSDGAYDYKLLRFTVVALPDLGKTTEYIEKPDAMLNFELCRLIVIEQSNWGSRHVYQ